SLASSTGITVLPVYSTDLFCRRHDSRPSLTFLLFLSCATIRLNGIGDGPTCRRTERGAHIALVPGLNRASPGRRQRLHTSIRSGKRMSRFGLLVARLFGKSLPRFQSLDEAREQLLAARDRYLAALEEVSRQFSGFAPDYSPESLKTLESWYFQLWETGGF